MAKTALGYLEGNPGKNMAKPLDWADKFNKENLYKAVHNNFHKVLENSDNNSYRLIKSLRTDIDPDVRYEERY